jgi:hypothetical protein
MHFGALRRDERTFAKHAARLLQTNGGRYEKLVVEFCQHCFEPLFQSPYRITRAYAASLVKHARSIADEVRGMKAGEFVPMPAAMLFMNRLQFGFYSVLARLDVEVDYGTVERTFLSEAGIVEDSSRG